MTYDPNNSNLFKFYLTETVFVSVPDFFTILALLTLHRKNFLSPKKSPAEVEVITVDNSPESVLMMALTESTKNSVNQQRSSD